ncbi:MAG: hypothetical protein Q9174_001199 [Haloplaca sp. 1 TL-2023]
MPRWEKRTGDEKRLHHQRKRSREKQKVLGFMYGKTELDHFNTMQLRYLKKRHPRALKGLLLLSASNQKPSKAPVTKEETSEEEAEVTTDGLAGRRRSDRVKEKGGDIINYAGVPGEPIDLTSSPLLAPDDFSDREDPTYHEPAKQSRPSSTLSTPTAMTLAPSIPKTPALEEDNVKQEVTEEEVKAEDVAKEEVKQEGPKDDDIPEVKERWELKAKLKRIGFSKWVDKLAGSPPTKDDLLEAYRKGKRCKRVADGAATRRVKKQGWNAV